MEQNKGFWYADWSFPIFVGLLSSGRLSALPRWEDVAPGLKYLPQPPAQRG